MSDPLSISASIAGLASLADLVYGRIYKYVKAVKTAKKEIAALSSEIGALYGILSRLRVISEQLEDDASEWTTRPYHLHSCNETLKRVKSILDKDDTTTVENQPFQTVKRKLRWPFSSSEVKEMITQIDRHKATLGLALNVDGMSGLLRALSKQDEINESMKGIHKELKLRREAETRVAIDQHRQKVLDSFGTIDPRTNHEMNRKLRHPNTGLWLTESKEFKLWLETPNARLWLYGIPGAGKTILASLIIDTILPETNPSVAAAYFYCDYKDSTTQEPHRVLGSLVQQLAKQDEQSFSRLQRFHDLHGEGRKHPVEYDPENLRQLIIDIATNYDCTVIVIDGLDECGTNAGAVTELIANFQGDEQHAEFKILLLSRDEIDIRQRLDQYSKISIAARSEDLRLYVGAEIENRTRKKMLNIKTPELRDHVRQKLVDGAEGMFRWVTCQMDYLCELPSDAARRRALEDLPHGLYPTYERILSRVIGRNKEAQKLVQRTLQLIAHEDSMTRMTTDEICEAISVNIGDNFRNLEAVPEVTEILRHCSSLIRLSTDGRHFEFAHFTVQEFLKNLGEHKESEFAAFPVYSNSTRTHLTKVFLTYLNFSDFAISSNFDKKTTLDRFEQYPLREYSVNNLADHARASDWSDPQLLSLAADLFHPSKPNNLITFLHDMTYHWHDNFQADVSRVSRGFAEATALHFAAMFGLPQLCNWLVENGCDINQRSAFGTPLHCAQLSGRALSYKEMEVYDNKPKEELDTIELLLNAGADPNVTYHCDIGDLSPLFLAAHDHDEVTTQRLLKKGAIVDDRFVDLAFKHANDSQVWDQLEMSLKNAQNFSLGEKNWSRVLTEAFEAGCTELNILFPSIVRSDQGKGTKSGHYEASLRIAAYCGQVKVAVELLDDHRVDVNAAEEDTFLTALHYASMTDQVELAQVLWERGAIASKTDSNGKTPLHYCVQGRQCLCLSFFLAQGLNPTVPNHDGLTAWHLAALDNNVEAIRLLLSTSPSDSSREQLQSSKTRSLISCASQSGHTDVILLLLQAGFSVFDLDSDGCTPLHYGAKSRSPDVIRLLIARGLDPTAKAYDGSSAMHHTVTSDSPGLDLTLAVLMENKVDPFAARKDGSTPIHLLFSLLSMDPLLYDPLILIENLQTLAALPDLFHTKQKSMDDALGMVSRFPTSGRYWILQVFEILLENGANLAEKYEEQTALEILLAVWQKQTLDQGLNRRANSPIHMTSTMVLKALSYVPSSGPLHELCAKSDLLLSAIYAMVAEYEQITHKLLDHFPDVDMVVGATGDSPMRAACRTGCSRGIIKRMLQTSKASSDNKLGSELIRETCPGGGEQRYEVLVELLEQGLDPNGASAQGETALMFAAQARHSSMVELLLSHGGSAKVTDQNGWTVAHFACCVAENLDVLYTLSDKDLDWNAKATASLYGQPRKGVTALHLAAALKDEGAVLKYLLEENLVSKIDGVTNMGETALFVAAWSEAPQNVAFLLSKGADPLKAGLGGESSLHLTARFGNDSVMSEFINHGCDLKTPDSNGLNCEMLALKYGHQALAKRISDYIREEEKMRDSNSIAWMQDSHEGASEPLRVAIDIGDLDLCKRIVQQGLDLEATYEALCSKDCNGITPLLYSINAQQPAIAEYLALEGANPAWKSCSHATFREHSAFHHAASYNYVGLLRILSERHPIQFLHLTYPIHPIHLAVVYQAPECVSLMLTHAGKEGNSAVMCQYSDDSFSKLANQRVAVSDQPSHGEIIQTYDTPLVLATKARNQEIARLIIEAGGLVNDGDLNLDTPLHHAAALGDTKLVELLLEAGANPQVQNFRLETPSMTAAKFRRVQALETLRRGGADYEKLDGSRRNVLFHAISGRTTKAFVYLLGAIIEPDLAHRNLYGESVLEEVFRFGELRLQTLLLNWAPNPDVYAPGGGNILTSAVMNLHTVAMMKMLLKRVPQGLLPTLLIHGAHFRGTPLYVACVRTTMSLQLPLINLLLDAGADPNYEGGEHGTPLMGACAAGRFEVVKLLVRKGANMVYHNETGRRISALNAAKHFPEIVRWLLVGRFVEGPKLLTDGESGCRNRQEMF